jgi:hypothetical protein
LPRAFAVPTFALLLRRALGPFLAGAHVQQYNYETNDIFSNDKTHQEIISRDKTRNRSVHHNLPDANGYDGDTERQLHR